MVGGTPKKSFASFLVRDEQKTRQVEGSSFLSVAQRKGYASPWRSAALPLCISAGPFSCLLIVRLLLVEILLRDTSNKRVVRVWIGEERAYGQQHFGHRQRRAPLLFQDIQTYLSVRVNIAMVDTRPKLNLGWLEWIVGREVNVQEKDTSSIRRACRPDNCGYPLIEVVAFGHCGAVCRRVEAYLCQFFLYPLRRRGLRHCAKSGGSFKYLLLRKNQEA